MAEPEQKDLKPAIEREDDEESTLPDNEEAVDEAPPQPGDDHGL